LDAYVEGSYGGAGAVFDWQLAADVAAGHERIILAGGLNPENVKTAVAKVNLMESMSAAVLRLTVSKMLKR